MAGIAWAIWSANKHESEGQTKSTLFLIGLVEVLLLIFGVRSGYISAGIIYTLIVLGAVWAFFVYRGKGG